MLLEKVLFPAPNPPHYTLESHTNHLIWLPNHTNSKYTQSIPCMLYLATERVQFFIIWCHGNGCDIGSMHSTLKKINRTINAHILIFEYPSYGLCVEKLSAKEDTINEHTERAYSFVCDKLQWPTDRVVIYGHSIGSGPACYIASIKSIGGLILQSPYTSIKNLIREKIGMLSFLVDTSLWDNVEALKNKTFPILLIHGQRDDLISLQHSQTLYDSLNQNNNKKLVVLPEDDHNSMEENVIVFYIRLFLHRYFPKTVLTTPLIKIDPILYKPPTIIKPQPINILASAFKISVASMNTSKSILSPFSRDLEDNGE